MAVELAYEDEEYLGPRSAHKVCGKVATARIAAC